MDDVTITREADFDISADELWRLVSDPADLGSWLGDSVDVDVRPGGTGVVVDGDLVRDLRIERVVTGQRIELSWWDRDQPGTPSRVLIEVGSHADGTSRLTIRETLAATASASQIATARMAWEVRVLSLWACTVAVALVQ